MKKSYSKNKSIECFFIERAKQFLKEDGYFALVLPISILQKGGIFEKAREILLEHFKISCIVSMNNKTFGSTGTQTAIIFAQKTHKIGKDSIKYLKKCLESGDFNLDTYKKEFTQNDPIEAYCKFLGYNLVSYIDFLSNLILSDELKNTESFQNYLNDYKKGSKNYFKKQKITQAQQEEFFNGSEFVKTIQVNKKDLKKYRQFFNDFKESEEYKQKEKEWHFDNFLEQVKELELEKLLYFSYVFENEVLTIKSPEDKTKDNKSNKNEIIKFLGYDWSNRKGDEGIKYQNTNIDEDLKEKADDSDEEKKEKEILRNINSVKFINTPLYNPKDRNDKTKLNYAIRAFMQDACSDELINSLQGENENAHSIFKAKLIDMIDFEKVEFNKVISLNPKTQRREIKSKYSLVKLETCGDFFMGGTPSRKNSSYWNGEIKWLTIGDYSNHQVITDTKEKITQQGFKDSNAKMIQKGAVVVSIYATIGRVGILGESMTTNQAIVSIVPNEWFINKYLMYAIDYFKFQLFNETITTSQKNINLGILQNMIIPKPPLEIQKQIVAECEKVEKQYNTIRMSIEEYQNLIKAILVKTGVIDDANSANSGGGGANSLSNLDSIVENLVKLESQLDFNLLLSIIENEIYHSEALAEKSQKDFNTFKNFSAHLKELLESLPTPPQNGWERISLKNTKYLELNPNKKEIAKYNENTLVSFIEMASVSDKGYIEHKANKPLKEVKKGYTYFAENDILIAKITPCMENGKCAIAKNLTNHIGFGSTEFHIFRAKTGLDSSFLFHNLNQQNIREKAALAMTGASGHKRVPISFYENLTIPLPPLEVQEKIAQTIEAVESQISFVDFKLSLLESQKDTILKEYLSGSNERERERERTK